MDFLGKIPDIVRSLFNDGLDEVLIFVIVFAFILISGRETDNPDENEDKLGILPLLIIAGFLLLFAVFGNSRDDTTTNY